MGTQLVITMVITIALATTITTINSETLMDIEAEPGDF